MFDGKARFTTDLAWTDGKRGKVAAGGIPEIEIATPPEFGGPGGRWSPEHLFVASADACLMATFLAVAAASKLRFADYRSSATGTLENVGGKLEVTEIVMRPRLTLYEARDEERARRLFAKAEDHCLISRSMKSRIVVEPEIVVTTEAHAIAG